MFSAVDVEPSETEFQLLTKAAASTLPRPEARSYPLAALYPVIKRLDAPQSGER